MAADGLGVDLAADEWAGGDGPPGTDDDRIDGRTSFEPAEFVGLAVLTAVTLLALGSVVGSLVSYLGQPTFGEFDGSRQAIVQATSWANPLVSVVVVAVAGLAWWQASSWTDAIVEYIEGEERSIDETGLPAAFAHLGRSRLTAFWATALAVVAAGASLALAVTWFTGHPDRVVEGEGFEFWGWALGNLVLTVACVALARLTVREIARGGMATEPGEPVPGDAE